MIKEVVKYKIWCFDGTGSKVMETELIFIKKIVASWTPSYLTRKSHRNLVLGANK